MEARSYRDRYEEILSLGAVLVGVSRDSTESHRRFREANQLPFPLIADSDGALGALYGVRRRWTFGIAPVRRATFIIDREGVVCRVFHHELAISRHVDDVVRALKELNNTATEE